MQDKLLAGGLIYLILHFVCNVVLSGLAGSGAGKEVIFNHSMKEVSAMYEIQITPAGYTFQIWNVIFVWILAAHIYLIVNIFRTSPISTSEPGSKFYCSPPIFGPYVCLALLTNYIFLTVWLFLWDNHLLTASAVALITIAVTSWLALVLFSISLWKNAVDFKAEAPKDLFLHRILIQNGLALYATWTTIASLVNLAIALVHGGNANDEAGCLVALSFLAILIIIFVPLELMFWDNYVRYMIAPYFVLVWALVGMWVGGSRKPEEDIQESVIIFSVVLGVLAIVLLLIRIGVTIFRYRRRPLYIGLSTRGKHQGQGNTENGENVLMMT